MHALIKNHVYVHLTYSCNNTWLSLELFRPAHVDRKRLHVVAAAAFGDECPNLLELGQHLHSTLTSPTSATQASYSNRVNLSLS